jgi:hypothetical protein
MEIKMNIMSSKSVSGRLNPREGQGPEYRASLINIFWMTCLLSCFPQASDLQDSCKFKSTSVTAGTIGKASDSNAQDNLEPLC